MNCVLQPWHILLAVLSGWVNHRQQQIIEFQNAQLETLLKKLGKNRLLLSDDHVGDVGVGGKRAGTVSSGVTRHH